uniref:AlNc14C99G5994 protein n=1 Tax=Albugo laibachii Nc14 TaxID=890382 RepID=F0WHD0_9STRA|nr:AlNc14C99G5994 [Albugo laibachii Nc14]|eukprot:CCA20648.1 AlNc14C99G5994 [Albugo laibachii Nc14]
MPAYLKSNFHTRFLKLRTEREYSRFKNMTRLSKSVLPSPIQEINVFSSKLLMESSSNENGLKCTIRKNLVLSLKRSETHSNWHAVGVRVCDFRSSQKLSDGNHFDDRSDASDGNDRNETR